MSESECPLCGGVTTEAFVVGDRNRGIGTERFAYRHCEGCGGYYVADPPVDLGRYYPDEYYLLPDVTQLDHAANAESPKLELLRPFAAAGSLVDVGAGLGLFARAAANAGYDVTAIEMDDRCCAYLEGVVGVRTMQSERPDEALADLEPMRAITLWHVLEHLPNPWAVLGAAAERLEPGGALLVATPNPDSIQFRILRTRWAHIDAPRHLFLVPFDTLRRQADSVGLTVAALTTSDAAGRHWNRFGWDYALRRRPSRASTTVRGRAVSVARSALAGLITTVLAPIERKGMNGAAYTAIFVKRANMPRSEPAGQGRGSASARRQQEPSVSH